MGNYFRFKIVMTMYAAVSWAQIREKIGLNICRNVANYALCNLFCGDVCEIYGNCVFAAILCREESVFIQLGFMNRKFSFIDTSIKIKILFNKCTALYNRPCQLIPGFKDTSPSISSFNELNYSINNPQFWIIELSVEKLQKHSCTEFIKCH